MSFTTEELNTARNYLQERITNYFVGKKGLLALYIQGSVAEDSADEFSDLDFRVVVKPEVYQQYILERFDAPKQRGEWLYNEWADRSWVCVSHFQPFNKVDLLYFKPDQIQPSAWFLLPTQILYDSSNLIQQVIYASQKQEFDLLTTEEVERLMSKGLAYSEEIYRRIMRGELFYAQSQLNYLRETLIQLDDYLYHDLPSSGFGSSSHFERRGSKTLVEVLKLSYSTLDRQLIIRALDILLGHYRTQIEQLHARLSLKRSLKTDLDLIETIQDLCQPD